MKTDWERTIPPVIPARTRLEAALGEVMPGCTVMTADVLGGGLANTNLAVRCQDGTRWVVRIYQRAPAEFAKEAAISRLLTNVVPVPEYLHVGPPGGPLEHPWALVRWIDAEPMDRLVLDQRQDELLAAARAAGHALAAIQSVEMPAPGFLAPDLTVPDPMRLTADAYMSWMEDALIARQAVKSLSEKTARRLQKFLDRWVPALDRVAREHSLVHSDYNGANIMVAGRRVAAVLDWEFAFAGSSLTDVGNMLRHFSGAGGTFREAFIGGFREAGGRLPEDWEPLAAVLDLLALADMLASARELPRRSVSIVASMEEHLSRF